MPIVKSGRRIEDTWTSVVGQESLPEADALIVDLEQWRARREELLARRGRLGIRLASDQSPERIADDLACFELVALEFPRFTDGRAYSYARILRQRYGFQGEIRAVGDVLLEQLFYMSRVGFDAFDLESENAEDEWRTAMADLSVVYQPTGDGRKTAMELRRSGQAAVSEATTPRRVPG